MKGASASFARRRAISVLPTPVGPIIRMFFGVISWRSGSGTCWRRQRLRNAMATARFARPWPTTCLSSSETISRGVMFMMSGLAKRRRLFQRLDGMGKIGIDAQVAGDLERFLHDVERRKFGVFMERARRRLRECAAGTDGADALLGLQHVAVAGDDQRRFAVRDQQHRFQPAQDAVGAPVFRQLYRSAHQMSLVLFQLAFE